LKIVYKKVILKNKNQFIMKRIFTFVLLSIFTMMSVNATTETTLWEGDVNVNWGDSNVQIEAASFANIPVDASITMYFQIVDMPDNYHCLRVTTPWWEDAPDFVPQVDGLTQEQSPYTFTFKASDKSNVETTGGMVFTGYGYKLTKIVATYDEPEPVVIDDLPAATLWTGEQEVSGWGAKVMMIDAEGGLLPIFAETITKACNLYFLVDNATGGDFRIAGAWGDWAQTSYPSDGYNHMQALDADNVVKVVMDETFVQKAFIENGGMAIWGDGGFIIKAIGTTKDSVLNTDGINTVATGVKNDTRYYNLNGQVVAHPTKGVYIKGGKKILVK
jgi:hypothetical protein